MYLHVSCLPIINLNNHPLSPPTTCLSLTISLQLLSSPSQIYSLLILIILELFLYRTRASLMFLHPLSRCWQWAAKTTTQTKHRLVVSDPAQPFSPSSSSASQRPLEPPWSGECIHKKKLDATVHCGPTSRGFGFILCRADHRLVLGWGALLSETWRKRRGLTVEFYHTRPQLHLDRRL